MLKKFLTQEVIPPPVQACRRQPLQQWDAPFPMRRSRIRESYFVKRRSFPDSGVSRFSNDELVFLSICEVVSYCP